jgi:hypothetical protein
LVAQHTAQLESTDRPIEETFYRTKIRMSKERLASEVWIELHDERIDQSRVSVMIKDVREPASDEQKIAFDKGCYIVPNDSIPAAFSHKCEFQLRMEMPRSAVVISPDALAENALLLAPRDLFANGKPSHIIKVSAFEAAGDQKLPLSDEVQMMCQLCSRLKGLSFEVVTFPRPVFRLWKPFEP